MSRIDNIFYDTTIDDRRYIFTKDKRNWVWAEGHKDASLETILTSKSTCYYNNIESMMVNLFETRLRNHVTEFTLGNFKKSLNKAFSDVRRLGKALDAVAWDKIKRGDLQITHQVVPIVLQIRQRVLLQVIIYRVQDIYIIRYLVL